ARDLRADREEPHVEHPSQALGQRPHAGGRLRHTPGMDQGPGDGELTVTTDVGAEIRTEQQKVTAEIRELDLLIESTQTEVNRLRSREDQLKTKVEEVRQNPANHQREEIFSTTDEFNVAMSRRMTMEGQLGALVAKRKLIDRSAQILNSTQRTLAEYSAPALPADATPLIDESRLLQAVVDTQEEERK